MGPLFFFKIEKVEKTIINNDESKKKVKCVSYKVTQLGKGCLIKMSQTILLSCNDF